MIALDTNLLVYAHRSRLPEHAAARRAIEEASFADAGWGIPLPCLVEFWSVVTHPAAAGHRSMPQDASSFLAALGKAGAKILHPREGLWERLSRSATEMGVTGSRVFDLQISLIAREAGASEIWTHDTRFAAVRGIQVVDPLA